MKHDLNNKNFERKAKRVYSVFACVTLLLVATAVPALAADDPLTVVNNLSDFIFSLIRAIGLILLGFGILQVGLSLKSHDPSQRANGIITVDGMDVEVPEDVYLAYAQADRRERYIMEEQSSGKLLSLEQMEEDALLPDYVGAETAPSAETEALEREELRNLAEQKQILLLALLSLKDTDRELINALFFDGASTREYAQRMGVSQRAVIKQRDRILRDLKKFFENSSK